MHAVDQRTHLLNLATVTSGLPEDNLEHLASTGHASTSFFSLEKRLGARVGILSHSRLFGEIRIHGSHEPGPTHESRKMNKFTCYSFFLLVPTLLRTLSKLCSLVPRCLGPVQEPGLCVLNACVQQHVLLCVCAASIFSLPAGSRIQNMQGRFFIYTGCVMACRINRPTAHVTQAHEAAFLSLSTCTDVTGMPRLTRPT